METIGRVQGLFRGFRVYSLGSGAAVGVELQTGWFRVQGLKP